jgi:flagellar hook-length control protein FliK
VTVQPLAIAGGAGEPRIVRAWRAAEDGDVRKAEPRRMQDRPSDQPETADFAMIHAALAVAPSTAATAAPVEAEPAATVTLGAVAVPEAAAAEADPPQVSTEPEATVEFAPLTADASAAPAGDESAGSALGVDVGRAANGPWQAAQDIPAWTGGPRGAAEGGDIATLRGPLQQDDSATVASGAAAARGRDGPERGMRAEAAPQAAPTAPIAPIAPAAPAATTERSVMAAQVQPRPDAGAALEATSRRAEAALERRAQPQTPTAAPQAVDAAQAVRAAQAPVAMAPPPVTWTWGDGGDVDASGLSERLRADAHGLGVGAAAGDRTAAAFPTAAVSPAADRAQASAAFAQLAPTLHRGKDGATELRLDPPELGRVRVTLRTGEHGLVAVVHVERPETLDLMRRHADILLRDLADAGQTRVDLSFAQFQGGDGQGRRLSDAPALGFAADDGVAATPAQPHSAQPRRSRAAGGLDIRV